MDMSSPLRTNKITPTRISQGGMSLLLQGSPLSVRHALIQVPPAYVLMVKSLLSPTPPAAGLARLPSSSLSMCGARLPMHVGKREGKDFAARFFSFCPASFKAAPALFEDRARKAGFQPLSSGSDSGGQC